MKIDPDKQYLPEVEDDYTSEDNDSDVVDVIGEKTVESKDFTQYGLVATVAKNGMVLLWEWKLLKDAKELALKNFEDM
jgi:hypothetical protein